MGQEHSACPWCQREKNRRGKKFSDFSPQGGKKNHWCGWEPGGGFFFLFFFFFFCCALAIFVCFFVFVCGPVCCSCCGVCFLLLFGFLNLGELI